MLKEDLDFIKKCIAEDNVLRFYKWKKWKMVRADVLKLDKNECQKCKAKGKKKKAKIVHHILRLRKHPELALSIYHNGKRQLISLCASCHEEEHPEERHRFEKRGVFINEERW